MAFRRLTYFVTSMYYSGTLDSLNLRMPNDKYNAQRRLRERLQRIEKRGQLQRNDVLYIVNEWRSCIEQRGLRESYPVLTLYADWSVHPMIDRNALGHQIVGEIFAAFTEFFTGSDPGSAAMSKFVDKVSVSVRLDELLAEFTRFCRELMLPDILVRHAVLWRKFCGWMLEEIFKKPLCLPQKARALGNMNKSPEKIYAGMRALLAAKGLDDSPPGVLPYMNGGFWFDEVPEIGGAKSIAVIIPWSIGGQGDEKGLFAVQIAPSSLATVWPPLPRVSIH